ncbi:hypothetical protein PAXRUDRAFT_833870 [Paxillus rubicundulus Ve08.2h10]|uniref:Uncharacterized protein n=1 Tax=Paxillus rubicundulus Ve08.2h10 TaxID=930991 RepID=A0A0D0D895_9AGAM|nr:hypothetical protein PAXRUDRAFT_833870 [Paxillus rubicundulus Ve08.2h10]
MRGWFLAVLLLLAALINAQTETVIANGATVVEVVTENALGNPTTLIVQTIINPSNPFTSLTSSTALTASNPFLQTTVPVATSTTPAQVGPVGQPATQPPAGGPTPYTYTTTDANGETVAVEGIFTPTGPPTVLPPATTTGTILNYSQWQSMVGTHTQPANAASRMPTPITTSLYYLVATTFAGLAGGAWLVIF